MMFHRPYVPPRAAWAAAATGNGNPPQNFARPLSPMHASPAELPAQQNVDSVQLPMHALSHSPPPDSDTFPPSPLSPDDAGFHVRMNSSGNYYEDVDPRFIDPIPIPPPPPPTQTVTSLPRSLTPGGGKTVPAHGAPSQPSNYHPAQIHTLNSHDAMPEDALSPTLSETSNYTSSTQRGIEPQWRSPPPSGEPISMGTSGVPNRRPVPQQQHQQPQPQQQQLPSPPPTNALPTNPDLEIARDSHR